MRIALHYQGHAGQRHFVPETEQRGNFRLKPGGGHRSRLTIIKAKMHHLLLAMGLRQRTQQTAPSGIGEIAQPNRSARKPLLRDETPLVRPLVAAPEFQFAGKHSRHAPIPRLQNRRIEFSCFIFRPDFVLCHK